MLNLLCNSRADVEFMEGRNHRHCKHICNAFVVFLCTSYYIGVSGIYMP